MNRNVESHFSEVPYIDKPRSIFDRSFGHKTSFNAGNLIPFYIDSVLPGDTFRVTTSKVVRMQTLLSPIFDNLYLDTYYFFVPWRLVYDHTREFFGENTQSAWVQTVQYRLPAISSPSGGFASGSLADYFGLPVGVEWSNQDLNAPMALPFRAYALICQEFFRDQNLSDPLNIPTGDADQTGSNGSDYINDVANGGAPFKVAKFHDYFTSCLPSPQKAAEPVSISGFNNGLIGVYSTSSTHSPVVNTGDTYSSILFSSPDVQFAATNTKGIAFVNQGSQASYNNILLNASTASGSSSGAPYRMSPVNLWANMSESSTVTVNELRLAFQMQRYYEQLARGGSRYIEYMRNFYGVTSPDARLQRPEYLGGNRVPINIDQVTNTSQGEQDFLGDLGAQSVTSDVHEDFEKSFTEFGFVLGLCCVRYDHTYSQGIERFWTRRDLFDQYVPTLAHIGEQPVYKYEIYADGNMNANTVFGYNEAWSDYRYKPSRLSGEMRPGISNSLASWHLGDYYTSAPTLSDEWIREDANIIDRVLAVGSTVSNQFFADIYVKNMVTRVMPMYSVPGLIDHF